MGRYVIAQEMKENYRIRPDMDYIKSVKDTEPVLFTVVFKNALKALIGMRNYIQALQGKRRRKYVHEYVAIMAVLREVYSL